MFGVEMRAAFIKLVLEHAFATCVDDRDSQTFCVSSLPVRSAIPVSEIAHQKSSLADPHPELIIDQARRLIVV